MDLFVQISLVIVLATIVAGFMRLIKQPLIIGHIITGILVGPQFLNMLQNTENIEIFSKIGISILLFIVGIGLSPRVIREVGKIAIFTGIGQVIFTSLIGFLLCLAFGYSVLSSLYISIALTFSSTIIVLKLLSDRKDLEKLYAKIAVGFLLIQDVIATLLLIFVSTLSVGENAGIQVVMTLGKGLLLTILLFFISTKILPRLANFFASSPEYLFLFSLAWGFGMAVLYQYAGLSVEIGAMLAGASLSVSPYAQEISSKLKTLRDFFIITFFILLGSTLKIENISALIIPTIILSIFVLVGNPFIVLIIMGILGYNRKTSFYAGLTVAQISEFSLILALLGVQLGHISQNVLSLITLVGLITIAGSSYLIIYSDKLYKIFNKYLMLFERKKHIKDVRNENNYDVVLFGCNRIGYDFIRIFKHMDKNFLAIDFNPEVVREVAKSGVHCIYGDAEDAELLEDLNLHKSKMVVSTIPDHEANEFLIKKVRSLSADTAIIVISYNLDEALTLYEEGATYVILPHFISGQYASEIAHKANFEIKKLEEHRNAHIDYLRERKSLGHTHPIWKHNHHTV